MKLFSYEDIFSSKQKVLFVMAHPTDVEVYFGGLIGRLQEDHKHIKVIVMCGTAPQIIEQKLALQALGLSDDQYHNFGCVEGQILDSLENVKQMATVMKEFTPEVVCTHEVAGSYVQVTDSQKHVILHRDHRHTGTVVLDAVYPFSRDPGFFTEHVTKGIFPNYILDVILTGEHLTNCRFRVDNQLEKKKAALRAYTSKFNEQVINDIIEDNKHEDEYIEVGHYLKLDW